MTVRGRRGVFAKVDIEKLENFLLDQSDVLPGGGLIESCNLGAYAYARIPSDAAERNRFRAAYVAGTARHLQIRASLQPLLAAWVDAGIEPLVFKGFYLAEFVHSSPAHRPYRDVDILIDPERASVASGIATAHGWIESWRAGTESDVLGHRERDDGGHEVMHLDHPELGVRLDVHRRIVPNKLPWTHIQERLTDAVWDSAERQPWADTSIYRLCPEDSLIVGIVLNRCWTPEDWHVRPHDILDMKALTEAFDLTRDRVLARSRQLDCARTVRLFLERCDPFRGELDLSPPSAWRRHVWNLQILRERGHPTLERNVAMWSRIPNAVLDVVAAFPDVLAATRALRRDPRAAHRVGSTEPREEPTRELSYDSWRRLKRGVRWAFRMLRIEPDEHPELWALALYRRLRDQGYAPRLDAGAGRSEDAWLRLVVGGVTLVTAEPRADDGSAPGL